MVRLQALDAGAGREVTVLPGGDVLLEDDVLELAVLGHDDAELGGAMDLAEAGPELDATRAREARGDAGVELGVLGHRDPALAGKGRVVDRGSDRRSGGKGSDQEAAAAEPLRALHGLKVWGYLVQVLQ